MATLSRFQNPHVLSLHCGFESAQALVFPDASGLVFQRPLSKLKRCIARNPGMK